MLPTWICLLVIEIGNTIHTKTIIEIVNTVHTKNIMWSREKKHTIHKYPSIFCVGKHSKENRYEKLVQTYEKSFYLVQTYMLDWTGFNFFSNYLPFTYTFKIVRQFQREKLKDLCKETRMPHSNRYSPSVKEIISGCPYWYSYPLSITPSNWTMSKSKPSSHLCGYEVEAVVR